jgi:primary-amine oxidase
MHPLDAVTADELATAVAVLRAAGKVGEHTRFPYAALAEPDKEVVRAYKDGDPVDRCIRLEIVDGPDANVAVAIVSVTKHEVRSWVDVPGARPAILFEEAFNAMIALKAHPEWQAAMRKRGIENLDLVQIDPWPAGTYGVVHEDGRRITRCISYVRETPEDNGYARPVEGVVAYVDLGRGEVLEVEDHGVVPLPPERGSYLPADVGPMRTGLRPLEITQPEGPSFVIDGNHVSWQRWSLRVSMDPYEGLVLHTVGYDDGGRVRPILYRAAVSEMVVPYGEPSPAHAWKNAFDTGEWGLGRMANSLTLGCDCVGEIRYLDAAFLTEGGEPFPVPNVVCVHEEDYGILWKHQDLHGGTTEVRRSRRLVVSSIATVGNYEYGFYWYFYLDGTIQLEVKLTGILQTMAVAPGEAPAGAPLVAPQLAAPVHQHLFNMRMDVEVDGPANTVEEVEAVAVPPGPDNPVSNAFAAVARPLTHELEAQRDVDPSRSRYWRIVNPAVQNRLGRPVAYRLLPGATPTMLADPDSSVGRRAAFASHNLWVTPHDPAERRAAGDFPNQSAGGDGLPAWTQQDRPIEETDVVVWYTFGVTHVPRPEDWPVMPVEYTGFTLSPAGFFDRNPALDVPAPEHCHTAQS